MFCPECGSTDKKMVGDICIDCFLKDFQMMELPKRIEVQILRLGKDKDTYFATFMQHSTGSSSCNNQARKINKRHPSLKGSKTVSICSCMC